VTLNYGRHLDNNANEFNHAHQQPEIYYMRDGELFVEFEDRTVELTKGDLLFIYPGVSHKPRRQKNSKSKYFALGFEVKKAIHDTINREYSIQENIDLEEIMEQFAEVRIIHVKTDWNAENLLLQMSDELYNHDLGWSTYLNALYFSFFIQALRKLPFKRGDYSVPITSYALAQETYSYIQEHYSENITIHSIADYLGVSERHVNRLYRNMYDTTFAKALRTMRLTFAKRLLETGEMSVDEIAERCGFSSTRSFRKIFRDNEEMSVGAYRKLVR
jgi:AraC-like DNA-binding protein